MRPGFVMVEFPEEEARAITGQIHDRDLEESALQRVERAIRIEDQSPQPAAKAA